LLFIPDSPNYASTTNQSQSTPLPITYPPPLPHTTYPMPSSQSHQAKTGPNLLPPLPTQQQEPLQHGNNFLTYGTIHTITEGSNVNFQNKRQRRDYYHQVNRVAVEGPIIKTKWSHQQITFTATDIKLVSFPHTDAMVITTHIDKWHVTKVSVDNGVKPKSCFC
jgi:hypothetical protein